MTEGGGRERKLVVTGGRGATNSGDFFPLLAQNRMWRQNIEDARTITSYVGDRITALIFHPGGHDRFTSSLLRFQSPSSARTNERRDLQIATPARPLSSTRSISSQRFQTGHSMQKSNIVKLQHIISWIPSSSSSHHHQSRLLCLPYVSRPLKINFRQLYAQKSITVSSYTHPS